MLNKYDFLKSIIIARCENEDSSKILGADIENLKGISVCKLIGLEEPHPTPTTKIFVEHNFFHYGNSLLYTYHKQGGELTPHEPPGSAPKLKWYFC